MDIKRFVIAGAAFAASLAISGLARAATDLPSALTVAAVTSGSADVENKVGPTK
jgi:hypothetical protein